jgi:hypothetical protein
VCWTACALVLERGKDPTKLTELLLMLPSFHLPWEVKETATLSQLPIYSQNTNGLERTTGKTIHPGFRP